MKIRCSDDEMLADYFEGRLSGKDRTRMEAHLSRCKECREVLAVANSIVRARNLPSNARAWPSARTELNGVSKEVTETAVRLVSRQAAMSERLMQKPKLSAMGIAGSGLFRGLYSKISDFLRLPWAEWRLAPIRGSRRIISQDLVHLRKNFDGVEMDIEIEKTGENKAYIRVKSGECAGDKETLRVTLKRGEREISSYLLGGHISYPPNNGAYVLFEDVPFGHYSLVFLRDGENIGTYLFEIKGTNHDGRQ